VLVMAIHNSLEPVSPARWPHGEVVIIMTMAFVPMRLVAREASIGDALLIGVAWLSVSIMTEMIAAAFLSHGWFPLIGSLARPLLRNVLLVAWTASPELFARRRM